MAQTRMVRIRWGHRVAVCRNPVWSKRRFNVPCSQECRKMAIRTTEAVPGMCNENRYTCEARLRGYRWADQATAAGIELADRLAFCSC